MKKHIFKMFERFIQNELFNLFEISPFGVSHCVDYSAFVCLSQVVPKSKDIYEKLFCAIFVYIAMEMLISIKRASSKTFLQAHDWYEIQFH